MGIDLLARLLPQDPPDPTHDPAEVRERADDILSRPEYREPAKSLPERIEEAIGNFLEDLLSAVGLGGGAVPAWVSWLVLAVLVAVVVTLLAWAVRSGGWGRSRRREQEEPVIISSEAGRAAADWLAEAEDHEAAGRWREGLLCRYRALVVRMIDADVVPATPGRTAGEYVGDVRQRLGDGSPASTAFTAATDLFEVAWYGGVETGPDERDRFAGLADGVVDAVGERSRA